VVRTYVSNLKSNREWGGIRVGLGGGGREELDSSLRGKNFPLLNLLVIGTLTERT